MNSLPIAAVVDGDHAYGGALSYLPGQRLSRCTCDGENHPGPKHADGTYVGRSAPEIDIFEAQMGGSPLIGQVSQSAQWAVRTKVRQISFRLVHSIHFQPFNREYNWLNTSDNEVIADLSMSALNGFKGSATQQATSVVTDTNQQCYELVADCFSVYGFEASSVLFCLLRASNLDYT